MAQVFRFRTALLIALVTVALLAQFVVTDSLAVFTHQEVNAANTFTTGDVSIDDGPTAPSSPSPA